MKDQILNELSFSEFKSGQELAELLAVSRNSIWKHINQLREEGYEIESVPNKGYRLQSVPGRLSKGRLVNLKATNIENVLVLPEVDSTNNYAKTHQADFSSQTLIVTDHQLAGRGRYGRSFYSPAGDGLYFTYCFKGPGAPLPAYLTIGAAVAMAKALEKLAFHPEIKWVNDIYLNHKKVCGILTEGEVELESGQMKYIVLGIGLNINNGSFPEELKDQATSLALEKGEKLDVNLVAKELFQEIEKVCTALSASRPLADYQAYTSELIQEFNDRLYLKGQKVTLEGGDAVVTGTLVGADELGHIILTTGKGEEHFSYGEFRLKKN